MDNKIATAALSVALETGADFAELYVQSKISRVIEINYKRVDDVSERLTYGAGLRLMRGTVQVYGYTSDLSEQSLVALAKRLSASFDGERVLKVGKFKEIVGKANAPKVEHSSMSIDEKIEYLKKGEQAMYAVSPNIVNATAVALETDENVEIYTVAKGVCRKITDRRVRTRLAARPTASRDGAFETGYFGPGLAKGAELYDEIDFEKEAAHAAEVAVKLLDAPECPSGKMPVVIGNAFGGVLFHEACGHPLEGTAISHGSSPFSDKLGQKIASDVVTAIDDGTVEFGWGSESFDDEGEKPTKNVLIKDGVLTAFMMDEFNGRRMGSKSTGACRRESFRYMPTTRMTNTYIAAGKSTPEEIIAATEYGVYCVSFAGGSVNPATDKFNFTSSETYIIRNGKICELVKSPALVGFGYEVLMKIDMVANDLELSAGTCGAASGMIPTSVGQPTLRVSEMTVGGKAD